MDGYEGLCPFCHVQCVIGPHNAVIYLYAEETWYNHAVIWCKECGKKLILWLEADDIELLIAEHLGVITDQFAPDDLRDNYDRCFKTRLPRQHRLTAHEEQEVGFWHYLLSKVRTANGFLAR